MRNRAMGWLVGMLGVLGGLGWLLPGAALAAAPTPGWECVPTTAGQAVVSGGTGASPSCASGKTPVLAPTYVASGVGGKPTVEFSAVNLQVVSGSGSTSGSVNGEGNVIVGYAENANKYKQTGSNDLVVGRNNGWSSYGEIVGGAGDRAAGSYGAVFGAGNIASGISSTAAGTGDTASGTDSAALGGQDNTASGTGASVLGGQYNLASDPFASTTGGCDNLSGSGALGTGSCASSGVESILGGEYNLASGNFATVSGGVYNNSTDIYSAVAGGCANDAGPNSGPSSCAGDYNILTGAETALGGSTNSVTGASATIAGGYANASQGREAAIAGGLRNDVSGGISASILGGYANTVSDDCQTFPDTGQGC